MPDPRDGSRRVVAGLADTAEAPQQTAAALKRAKKVLRGQHVIARRVVRICTDALLFLDAKGQPATAFLRMNPHTRSVEFDVRKGFVVDEDLHAGDLGN